MSSSQISAQGFDVEEVGKTFKSSKKRFTWKVQMDKTAHTIQLFASFISGKRKIVHNGTVVYEGKKGVGKDFSFPFNIGKNLVFIYELGESYSMKINNIEFSQLNYNNGSSSYLSSGSGITSKYIQPSFSGKDQDDTYSRPRTQTENKKPSSAWDDVKKASTQARSSVSGTSGGYIEKPTNKYSGSDNYVEKAGTKYSQQSSQSSSRQSNKNENPDDEPSDFLDLASHFTKFDYKDGANSGTTNTQSSKSKSQPTSNPSVNSRPSFTSNEPSPFESHQNTFTKPTQTTQVKTQQVQQKQEDRKENKIDFGNFGDFGNASQGQNVKKTAFDGFGGFDNFSNSQPSTKPSTQSNQTATQSKPISNQDLFELDFSTSTQPVQNRQSNNNMNAFDTTSEPTKLYGYDGYDSVYQPNKNTNQAGFNNQNSKITSNDLFGLDMSSTPQQQNNNYNQFQQPSYQQNSFQQPSYQQNSFQQPQQQKKTGWNSDLMALDLNELDNAKNSNSNFSNPQQNQNTGYGNNSYNVYGNQNQGSNPFDTNNVKGFSNPSQGGGYPGLFDGSSASTFGGNHGSSSYGGNNNYGGSQGFGGNQYGGPSNGGFGQNQNNYNQFGGGFQNTQVPVTTNKMATPFDDDF